MTDEPDDLRDQGGRMRRLMAALAVGVALAAVAYALVWGLAKPDEVAATQAFYDGKSGAYRFVYYITGLAFAAGLSITLVILNKRAAKRWRDRRIPQAKQLS